MRFRTVFMLIRNYDYGSLYLSRHEKWMTHYLENCGDPFSRMNVFRDTFHVRCESRINKQINTNRARERRAKKGTLNELHRINFVFRVVLKSPSERERPIKMSRVQLDW